MAERKKQPYREYMDFAALHDKPDDRVLAYMQKHGSLGLNPHSEGPSWDYQGRFVMGGPEPAPGSSIPAWSIDNIFFSPWGDAPPVNIDKVPEIEETPGLVQQEAVKMYLVIGLWTIIKKCMDKTGHLRRGMMLEDSRRTEITGLVDLMFELFPNSFRAFYLDLAPDSVPWYEKVYRGDKAVIKLPNFQEFFDNILTRVRLRVARGGNNLGDGGIIFSEAGFQSKNIFGFDIQKGSLDIEEGCLLARLWYGLISDLTGGTLPPGICPWCNQLFRPKNRSDQEYCSPWCQEAAKLHRYRERDAKKDGRVLRLAPGRPPKAGKRPVRKTVSIPEKSGYNKR